jgi:hypothetical protein
LEERKENEFFITWLANTDIYKKFIQRLSRLLKTVAA